MRTWGVLFVVMGMLFTAGIVHSQTLEVHYGGHSVSMPMANIDSLTFLEASPPRPAHITVDVDTAATDASGPFWRLSASATLTTPSGDPLPDGTPVVFRIAPASLEIAAFGYTGNFPFGGGEPVPGVAFTTLLYGGSETNDTVTVRAEYPSASAVLGNETTVCLPLVQGSATLATSPGNYSFTYPGPGWAQILVQVSVEDGHGTPIDGQLVHVSAPVGWIREDVMPAPDMEDQPFAMTEEGVASRWWLVTDDQVYGDSNQPAEEVEVSATVVWHPEITIEPSTVWFYR